MLIARLVRHWPSRPPVGRRPARCRPTCSARVRRSVPRSAGASSRRACSMTSSVPSVVSGAGGIERALESGTAVRRIEKNDVERASRRRRSCLRKPCADNSIAVFARRSAPGSLRSAPSRARVALHERHVRRAPAQRLDPDRARARRSHRGSARRDSRGQDVEQRLPQADPTSAAAPPSRASRSGGP